jgi:hypothetical protein
MSAQEVSGYSHEENIAFWNSIGQLRQEALYASTLHRFPYLANHMEFCKTSLGAQNFTNTDAFKLMMQILGR